MRTIFYSILLIIVMGCEGRKELPVMGEVEDFNLTNSDSSQFFSKKLEGKVWIFNLFFTSCQGPCPLITGNLKTVYQKHENNSNFAMLSVSVDPERDTAERLLEYAKRFNVDPTRWFFTVGTEELVKRIALDSFKLGSNEDAKIHSNRVVLVDQKGNIRGYYLGIVPEDIEKLKSDLNHLL